VLFVFCFIAFHPSPRNPTQPVYKSKLENHNPIKAISFQSIWRGFRNVSLIFIAYLFSNNKKSYQGKQQELDLYPTCAGHLPFLVGDKNRR